jgi:hypothetical protein
MPQDARARRAGFVAGRVGRTVVDDHHVVDVRPERADGRSDPARFAVGGDDGDDAGRGGHGAGVYPEVRRAAILLGSRR